MPTYLSAMQAATRDLGIVPPGYVDADALRAYMQRVEAQSLQLHNKWLEAERNGIVAETDTDIINWMLHRASWLDFYSKRFPAGDIWWSDEAIWTRTSSFEKELEQWRQLFAAKTKMEPPPWQKKGEKPPPSSKGFPDLGGVGMLLGGAAALLLVSKLTR